MEPNEIVEGLRQDVFDYDQGRPQFFYSVTRRSKKAADCIERLQAENESLAINGGKYIEISQKRYEMYEAAIKRAEDAECKLAEYQRRERAETEGLNG